jgi:hypothetical protein
VTGKNGRAGAGQTETSPNFDSGVFQTVDFLQQGVGRHNNTVADQATRPLGQDARGNQVQHGLLAVDDEGVARVVPSLEPDHGVGLMGQQVHDLAFALVTPLGSEDHHGSCHRSTP